MKPLAALLLCFALFFAVSAQDAPVTITAGNAASLRMLDAVGSALPGNIAFSPDSRFIAASTSEATFVYAADDLDAAPQVFPFTGFSFDADGFIVGGGQRWNLDTGLSIGIAPSIRVLPVSETQPTVIVEVTKPGGETVRIDTGQTADIVKTAVSSDYGALAAATAPQYEQRLTATVFLFRLPDGRQIAALPQIDYSPVDSLFFRHTGDVTVLISETYHHGHAGGGSISVYRADSGMFLPEYSGRIQRTHTDGPDGSFAYWLEDETTVIGTGAALTALPNSAEESYNTSVMIGSGGAAILSDKWLYVAPFDSAGAVGELTRLELPHSNFIRTFPFFAGDWLVYATNEIISVLDPANLNAPPRTIKTVDGVYGTRFSPDFTRYSQVNRLGRKLVRDTDTGRLLGIIANDALVSPDWSQAVYWQGGQAVVYGLGTRQKTTLDVIPGYLGAVADIDPLSGNVAFIGGGLRLADVNPDAGAPAPAVSAPESTGSAQFYKNGACLAMFEANPVWDIDDVMTIRSLNSEIPCGDARSLIPDYSYSLDVLESGDLLVQYGDYCEVPYGAASTNIYPMQGEPGAPLPRIIGVAGGCGRHSVAFTQDGRTVYAANGMALLRTTLPPDDSGRLEELVYYLSDGIRTLNDSPHSVFLSPDGKTIAVAADVYSNDRSTLTAYVEVYRVSDLEPETMHRDMPFLLTIPNATFAAFSPDSQYIATDAGLYAVKPSRATGAVDGTISAFSPDSTILATYQDGRVTLWKVPEPTALNFPLAQFAVDSVTGLAFNPDGTRLYVVRGGEVQMWGVSESR